MKRLRTLFHPLFIFIGVQVAWILLMAGWITWYVRNNQRIREFARHLDPKLFAEEFNWLILLEGCVLMLIILAGVYLIFVFWNKQARLNQIQSNFVSSVSHELKSPLASIQLYLETMKYHKISAEETRDFVETMLVDTERLSGLIDNILESSRPDQGSLLPKFQPVEMGAFLREVVNGYKRQFEDKGCVLNVDIQGAPVVKIDKRSMRMVFNNLISNALRYSPPGASLDISMKRMKRVCVVEFVDRGIGLEKRDLKKIFRKFYRVQNPDTENIEGAGLGLYISREIVRNHKGKIRVFSEGRDKGSRFVVTLPAQVG